MRGLRAIEKKGVIGPVISVFVMVLIISILAGLTFLFVSELKTQVVDTSARESLTVTNETGAATDIVNSSGFYVDEYTRLDFSLSSIDEIYQINGTSLNSSQYVFNSVGLITNGSLGTFSAVNVSYTASYIAEATAYEAVNDTEAAGATVVNYLSLIFLAVIFGAILTLVLRIILPYINLGKQMDGF